MGGAVTQALIGKKKKQLFLDARPAQPPTKLAIQLLAVWGCRIVGTAVPIEGVEVGVIVLEEARAVKLVSPILSHHLDLCSGVAPAFGRIGVRKNMYFFN